MSIMDKKQAKRQVIETEQQRLQILIFSPTDYKTTNFEMREWETAKNDLET